VHNHPMKKQGSIARPAVLVSGLLLAMIAFLMPIDVLGMDHLFTVHMAQHLLLSLIVPPLLLLGIERKGLFRYLAHHHVLARCFKGLMHPFVASVVFNGNIWIWHAPLLLQVTMSSVPLHTAVNLLYLLTGLLFWCPLFDPLSEAMPTLSLGQKLVYLFFNDMPMMLLGAGLTFSAPLYVFTMTNPPMHMVVTAEDQQLGGLLMWVGGSVFLLVFVSSILFLRWMLRQEKEQARANKMSTGVKHSLVVLVGLLLSSILFTACSAPASILDVAGPVADNERMMFYVILAVATVVFVGVEAVLIYSVVRFRARPDAPNPRQLHGSMLLELLWTIIPSIFLLIILGFTISLLVKVAPEAEPQSAHKLNVTAIGHQWWWEFYYDDYRFSTANTLIVPIGETVHVNLFSNNVIHSFWVPNVTGKTDVVPGRNNSRWFVVDKPGTYVGLCAEYCGTQHANMRFNVVAQDLDAFRTWVHSQQQPAVNPTSSAAQFNAENGKTVFQNNCVSCHGIVGVNQQSYANTRQNCNGNNDPASACLSGPDLTHFASRNLIAGGVLEHNPSGCADPASPDLYKTCTLAQWLKDPQGIKPGNDMNITLTDAQIRNLVAYLETLK
jgi:cytochrome c oxidase subunit 2